MNIIELKDSNYSKLIENNENTIFIDFFSPYCGPCQNLLSILEELGKHAEQHNVIVYKCDVSKNPKISNKYQIQSVPFTCVITKDKKIVHPNLGLQDPSYYFNIIEKVNPDRLNVFQRIFKLFKK